MGIFVGNYIICLILSVFENININKIKYKKILKYLYYFIVLQLLLLLMLRNNLMGVDAPNYKILFDNVGTSLFSNSETEIGYKLLTYFVKIVFDDFQMIIIICALVSVLPIAYFIKKYSKYPIFSLLIYIAFNYYYYDYITFRQSMAYGLVMIALIFAINKKLLPYVFFILVAASFHKSSLVYFPMYLLIKMKVNSRNLFIFFIFAIFFYLFRNNIFGYITNSIYTDYTLQISNSYNYLIFNSGIVIFLLFFRNKIILKYDEANAFFISIIIGCILLIGTLSVSNIIRITNFFLLPTIILIPNFFYLLKKDQNYIYIFIFFNICLFFVFYMYLSAGIDSQNMIYKFYWENLK